MKKCLLSLGILVSVSLTLSCGQKPQTNPGPTPSPGVPASSTSAAWVPVTGVRSLPTDTHDDWLNFRSDYPYHIQTIAMTRRDRDGKRTLIISEPPPAVTLEAIKKTATPLLANAAIEQQPIGHEGWAKDVVVELSAPDTALAGLVTDLSKLMYGTNYKPYVLELPALKPRTERYNLNLSVSAAEIHKWVLEDREMFTPVDGGQETGVNDISAQQTSGVYSSHEPGLVAWWIPRSVPVQNCTIQARQFSLDSDLIVGAVAKDTGVLIVGRERQVPVDVLPPLRFETIALLGSVQTPELAQSYERTHPFAGRYDTKENTDWAPILLSPELRDTEYGSLLNIADQFLKGWSNDGETNYENFAYDAPSAWPFSKPLPNELGVTEVTYNWNTTGAGYSVRDGDKADDYEVYALNRCGALPISYIPGEKARVGDSKTVTAENTAYSYFSKQNNAHLVRVVQYAALFQIFRHFPMANPTEPVPQSTLPEETFKRLTHEYVEKLAQATPVELESDADKMVSTGEFADLDAQLNDMYERAMKRFRAAHPNAIAEPRDAYIAKAKSSLIASKNARKEEAKSRLIALQSALARKSSAERAQYADKLADPGAGAGGGAKRSDIEEQVLQFLCLDQNIPERYSKEIESQSKGWIHTPVIVISTNSGASKDSIGGHNLGSRITQFEFSPQAKPGRVTVSTDGIVKVSVKDSPRLPEILRETAKAEKGERDITHAAAAMETAANRRLNSAKAPEIPSRNNALGIESAGSRTAEGRGFATRSASPEIGNIRTPDKPVTSDSTPASKLTVSRTENGTYRLASTDSQHADLFKGSYRADDASDLIARTLQTRSPDSPILHIEFDALNEAEEDAFMSNVERRYGSVPEEIRSLLRSKNVSESDVHEALDGKYDFSRSDVKFVNESDPIRTIADGRKVVELHVETPAVEVQKPSFIARVRLFFAKFTDTATIRSVSEKFMQNISAHLRTSTDALDAARMTRREFLLLKRLHPKDLKGLRHTIKTRNGDAYFTERKVSDRPVA